MRHKIDYYNPIEWCDWLDGKEEDRMSDIFSRSKGINNCACKFCDYYEDDYKVTTCCKCDIAICNMQYVFIGMY